MTAQGFSLRPPREDDAVLVAELLGVEADEERPAEIVRGWAAHWDEHGYGTWVIDGTERPVGFVGLSQHRDFVRVTTRTLEDEESADLAPRALRRVTAHALEWLPDLPLRIRVAPDDAPTRAAAESAGMEHVPELDHEVDGQEWIVLELAYVRVVDRIPPRAREAMLQMWVAVNEAGGSVGFLPGAHEDEVAAVLDGYERRLTEGGTTCVALNSPLGQLLGFGFVIRPAGATVAHTAVLERVMADPERWGGNLGSLLMAGLHRAAREDGVELVTLDYRDGTGLGDFYTRHGYEEVGRIPGLIRVAPDEERDSVIMARSL